MSSRREEMNKRVAVLLTTETPLVALCRKESEMKSLKIKEILEKSKTLTLEKSKSYLMLIDESSGCADNANIISESIAERLDVDILVAVVDNLDSFRIFELEPREAEEKKDEPKKAIQDSHDSFFKQTAAFKAGAQEIFSKQDEAAYRRAGRTRQRDSGRDDDESGTAGAEVRKSDDASDEQTSEGSLDSVNDHTIPTLAPDNVHNAPPVRAEQ